MNSGENVIQISIEDEMKLSYLDYAMSVIVGRALPDVRDGLKPVHRRVLYAMYELNSTFDRPYKKSARVVGEVIGKYHPHGDTAIYDAIVRMAQNFSMRCLLIDGQGNFGSVDGDAPAAMRYTEVRMSRFASEMLQDIDKETVNFIPNYDESLQEPFVLPTRIPNLLINGSSGIAVGMATNIPPHNLGEVVDGIVAFINEPDISIEDLTHIIKGPDFPTAGFICGIEGIKEVYNSGRGLIQLRGKMHIETPVKERENIVITEIPYQVNKTKLIEQIAELVRGKKISGIQDIRDESDRDGMRIVIELRKGESSQVITNQLFKYTQLQTTFGVIMLAIVNEQPRILNLKEILFQFIDFRREVVVRRTTFELKKAERRAHILESLKIALDHLDEVIEMIRSSESPQVARERLIEKFSFSDVQAQAILEMRLQRLTALERDKIIEEYEQTLSLISELTQILSDNRLVLDIIVKELQEIKERYGDKRRTNIIETQKDINIEDIIPDDDMLVTITRSGYIKRTSLDLYRSQKRGGKGILGIVPKDEDVVMDIFVTSNHSYLLFFTNRGIIHWLKVYELPEVSRISKGKAIVNLINLNEGEYVTSVLPVPDFHPGFYITMVTRRGIIKKTGLEEFSNPRKDGIISISLDKDDELITARITPGDRELAIISKNGRAVRILETLVKSTGRKSRGVKSMTLSGDDSIIGMEVITEESDILIVSENGYGKLTRAKDYPLRNRRSKGVIGIKVTKKNGPPVGILSVEKGDEVMLMTDRGKTMRMKVSNRKTGRNTIGVKLIDITNGEKLTSITRIKE